MRNVSFLIAIIISACGGSKSAPPSSSGGGAGGGSPAGTSSPASDGTSAATSAPESSSAAPPAAPAAAADKIDAAIPETKDAKPFPRRNECDKKGCNLARVVPDAIKPAADDKAPIVMWEEVMPPKAMMLMPKHSGLDLYGILLDGEVSIMADDIKDKQKRAWKMNGFHAPGVGVNIYSKEPTRLLMMAVVAGTSGSVAEQLARIDAKDKSIMFQKRSAPVTSFELPAKTDLTWGGGAYHVRLAYEEAPASMEFLLMSKNASVPEHVHDKEWEFLAIIDGDGELQKKGGNTKIAGATFLSIPPATPHGMKASGSTPTVAIQMYWPPGPEQRFKKMAEGSK